MKIINVELKLDNQELEVLKEAAKKEKLSVKDFVQMSAMLVAQIRLANSDEMERLDKVFKLAYENEVN